MQQDYIDQITENIALIGSIIDKMECCVEQADEHNAVNELKKTVDSLGATLVKVETTFNHRL